MELGILGHFNAPGSPVLSTIDLRVASSLWLLKTIQVGAGRVPAADIAATTRLFSLAQTTYLVAWQIESHPTPYKHLLSTTPVANCRHCSECVEEVYARVAIPPLRPSPSA